MKFQWSFGHASVDILSDMYLTAIVLAQNSIYFCFPLFPSFMLFFISILAELTAILLICQKLNLNWFLVICWIFIYDVRFFLPGSYSNMILMSSLLVILFLGGWLPLLDIGIMYFIPAWCWFAFNVVAVMFVIIWVRGTLPRYRFDHWWRWAGSLFYLCLWAFCL